MGESKKPFAPSPSTFTDGEGILATSEIRIPRKSKTPFPPTSSTITVGDCTQGRDMAEYPEWDFTTLTEELDKRFDALLKRFDQLPTAVTTEVLRSASVSHHGQNSIPELPQGYPPNNAWTSSVDGQSPREPCETDAREGCTEL